jgi:hypothetical protein
LKDLKTWNSAQFCQSRKRKIKITTILQLFGIDKRSTKNCPQGSAGTVSSVIRWWRAGLPFDVPNYHHGQSEGFDLSTGRTATRHTTEKPTSCVQYACWKSIFIDDLSGHPILCGLKILCALVLTIIKRIEQNVFLMFPKVSPSSSSVPNSTSTSSHSGLASTEVKVVCFYLFCSSRSAKPLLLLLLSWYHWKALNE